VGQQIPRSPSKVHDPSEPWDLQKNKQKKKRVNKLSGKRKKKMETKKEREGRIKKGRGREKIVRDCIQ
jgi:hypothetical protein